MCNPISLEIPNTNRSLTPGDRVRLGRFESTIWTVCYGWFSFGGNRPFYGWYLSKDEGLTVKPIQLPDLDDIYMIEH